LLVLSGKVLFHELLCEVFSSDFAWEGETDDKDLEGENRSHDEDPPELRGEGEGESR
jgi:hypothetical protein